MHFFASSLSVLGIAGIYSRLFRRSLAQTVSAAVFSISMLLYVLSILSVPLSISCALLMLTGWGGLVYFAVLGKKHGVENSDLGALSIYLLFAVFLFFYLFDKRAIGWDEISHWMLTLKNMHYFNSFGLGELSSTQFQSYPPAVQLFEGFHLILCPQFRESYAFMARDMLHVSLMIAPAFYKTKSLPVVLIRLGVLFFAPVVFYSSVHSMLYVDATIGLLFAYLLWLYFSEEQFDAFFLLSFVLSGSVLCLIKGIGAALFLLVIAVIILDVLAGRSEHICGRLRIQRGRFSLYMLAAAGLPLAAYFSWKLYMSVAGIPGNWNTGSISLQGLSALFSEPKDYQVQTVRNFIANLRREITIGVMPTSFAKYPFFFAGLCLFCGFCARRSRRGAVLCVSLFFAYGIYCASLLCSYLFVMNEAEAVNNASFLRYMNNIVVGICQFVLCLLLNPVVLQEKSGEGRVLSLPRTGLNLFCLVPAALAIVFPFLGGGVSSFAAQFLNARNDAHYVLEYRGQQQHLMDVCAKIEEKREKIWFIHQNCNGDMYYMARLHTAPIRLNPSGYSLAASNATRTDSYTHIYAPEDWSSALDDEYRYVYLNYVTDAFIDDYGLLFEDPSDIASHALYQVLSPGDEGGLVQLRLLDRQDESTQTHAYE